MIVEQKVFRKDSPHDSWARELGIDPDSLKGGVQDGGGGGTASDIDDVLKLRQEQEKQDSEKGASSKTKEEEKKVQEQEQTRLKELEEKAERSAEEEEELKGLQGDDEGDDADEDEEELTLEETQERIDSFKEKGEELTDEEKEQLSKLENSLKPTVIKLRDSYGYEELAEKEYDDNDEGLLQLSKDVATIEVGNALQQVHSASPLLAELYDHVIIKGLSEETFTFAHKKADHSSIDIKEESGQEAIVDFFFDKQNLGAEERKVLLDSYKNQGILDKKAKEFKQKLDDVHKEEAKAKVEQELAQKKAAEENSKKLVKDVDTIINSGKINGVPLSNTDRKELRESIYSDKLNEAWKNLSLEKRLLLDHIVLKDFGVKGIDITKVNKGISLSKIKEENNSRKGGLPQSTGGFKKKEGKDNKERSIRLSDHNLDVSELLRAANN